MLFPLRKSERRRRLLAEPFPDAWRTDLRENMFLYGVLSETEQARLRDRLRLFVGEKYWEGCGGLEITDEIRVTVAAWACLLVLGFDDFCFDDVSSVIVYPGSFLAPADRSEESEEVRAHQGEAHQGGPVVLSWWEVRWDGRRPGARNLVLHEFAHKLAELGDPAAGMPPIDDPDVRARWKKVVSAARRQLCEDSDHDRPTLLDPYGASSRAEFFAVATECFFLQPLALRRQHPELYEVLAAAYRQDPARRPPLDATRTEEAEAEYVRHVIAECTAAIRLQPRYVGAYFTRADFLCQQGDYDGAIADYSTVIDLHHGEDVEAFCERGIAYREKRCYEEAIADFDRAIALDPDYARAYCERGLAFLEQGHLDAGLADLDRTLRIDPKDDTAYHERALVHQERGDQEQALADLDAAIRLCPYEAA